MAHTYFAMHAHLVFSTRTRKRWLTPEVCRELFPYLATAIREQDTFAYIVGGHAEHVHALVSPGSRVLIPDLVKEVKRVSSVWIKQRWDDLSEFSWQEGYGAFSVSHSNLARVRSYIENQDAHHKDRPFEDEYRALLTRHGFKIDERYFLG